MNKLDGSECENGMGSGWRGVVNGDGGGMVMVEVVVVVEVEVVVVVVVIAVMVVVKVVLVVVVVVMVVMVVVMVVKNTVYHTGYRLYFKWVYQYSQVCLVFCFFCCKTIYTNVENWNYFYIRV